VQLLALQHTAINFNLQLFNVIHVYTTRAYMKRSRSSHKFRFSSRKMEGTIGSSLKREICLTIYWTNNFNGISFKLLSNNERDYVHYVLLTNWILVVVNTRKAHDEPHSWYGQKSLVQFWCHFHPAINKNWKNTWTFLSRLYLTCETEKNHYFSLYNEIYTYCQHLSLSKCWKVLTAVLLSPVH
jgi:hypothetical protein